MTATRGPILLVEDDPDLRDAFVLALRRGGYHVVAAGDGLRAVELAAECEPAAAVVDLLLPGQSGFQVAHALKERFGDRVRVLAMSGHTSPAYRHYAQASGADAFLPKPFGVAALLAEVARLCPVQPVAFEPHHRVKVSA